MHLRLLHQLTATTMETTVLITLIPAMPPLASSAALTLIHIITPIKGQHAVQHQSKK
jgi:hypothetical protein